MTAKDPLQTALDTVIAATKRSGAVGAFANELLPLLKKAATAQGERRYAVRDVGEIAYAVERSTEGETLVERRLSGKSAPFRCPKAVYAAMVAVMVEADRPLSIDEIIAATEAKLDFRPAEFQVRVALRFWLYRQPSVVVRSRAKYSAADLKGMSKSAHALWLKISK